MSKKRVENITEEEILTNEKLEDAECGDENESSETPSSESEKNEDSDKNSVDPLEALEKELTDSKESFLRLAAEYENFRKRTQREKEALFADITADCIALLLPTVDNLERALDTPDVPDNDPMKAGVEMILSNTLSAFARVNVIPFGKTGDVFDPNIHHCVSTAESEDVQSGHITMVMQKGYIMGDKVIRPAMVQVAE